MDDCISRKAAIDALADYIHNVDKVMGTGHLTADDCKDAAASVFEDLPSAQPERKKGKWIVEGEFIDCSVCRREKWSRMPYEDLVKRFRYCPKCGADMRGEKDE